MFLVFWGGVFLVWFGLVFYIFQSSSIFILDHLNKPVRKLRLWGGNGFGQGQSGQRRNGTNLDVWSNWGLQCKTSQVLEVKEADSR